MSARDQSYIDAMNEFRNGAQIAAAPKKTRPRDETTTTIVATDRRRVRNPLSVNSRYPRARSFEKDLLRYYEECSLSRSAARFKGERKKSYCARVAWTRIRTSGRYPDYPGFAREEDAMKKRKRTEKRNRKGQFVKKSSARKASKRVHRKAPARKAARRHRVKPETRRAAPRRHRAKPAARRAAPRRHSRKTRRYAREMPAPFASMSGVSQDLTVAEAYRLGRRSKPRKRRHSRARAPVAVAAAPRRRRRKTTTRRRSARRGYSRESLAAMEERICRNVYRTAAGRFKKPRRRRAKRVMTAPKRRRRVSAHRRQGKRIKSYLRAGDMISNPISGGEIGVLVGVTAVGYLLTDVLSRYLQSEPSGFAPSGTDLAVPNAASVLGFPSWWNIGAQTGLSLVGFIAGAEVSKGGKGGMGSAALYGVGLGAGVHLVSQLFTAAMARWAGSKTSSQGTTPNGTLARLYSGEIAAQNSQYTVQTQAQAATPPGNARPGFAGPPEGQLGYSPIPQQQFGLGAPLNHPQATLGTVPQISPPGWVYPPAGTAPVQLSNGTTQCQDGSIIPSSQPCAPYFGPPTQVSAPSMPGYTFVPVGSSNPVGVNATYRLCSDGSVVPANQPCAPGMTVLGTYFSQASIASTGQPTTVASATQAAQQIAQQGYYAPPTTAMSAMSQNYGGADSSSDGCGCMGFTPYDIFPD